MLLSWEGAPLYFGLVFMLESMQPELVLGNLEDVAPAVGDYAATVIKHFVYLELIAMSSG